MHNCRSARQRGAHARHVHYVRSAGRRKRRGNTSVLSQRRVTTGYKRPILNRDRCLPGRRQSNVGAESAERKRLAGPRAARVVQSRPPCDHGARQSQQLQQMQQTGGGRPSRYEGAPPNGDDYWPVSPTFSNSVRSESFFCRASLRMAAFSLALIVFHLALAASRSAFAFAVSSGVNMALSSFAILSSSVASPRRLLCAAFFAATFSAGDMLAHLARAASRSALSFAVCSGVIGGVSLSFWAIADAHMHANAVAMKPVNNLLTIMSSTVQSSDAAYAGEPSVQ